MSVKSFFICAVEILALKLRHDPDCKGIILPNSRETRLTQFTDDTAVISSSVASLKSSLQIINSFGSLSGLNLSKTKTKIMWIGSQKGNKDKKNGLKVHNRTNQGPWRVFIVR